MEAIGLRAVAPGFPTLEREGYYCFPTLALGYPTLARTQLIPGEAVCSLQISDRIA